MRALWCLVLLASCGGRFGAVYPPRPPASSGSPIADPPPSRVVAHVTVTSSALRSNLDGNVPRTGDGSFRALGGDRRYRWQREDLTLAISQGRFALDTRVQATLELPLSRVQFPIDVHVAAEPVIGSDYTVKLQSLDVKVDSKDRTLRAIDGVVRVFDTIREEIHAKLRDFQYPLRPTLEEAYARIGKPIELPLAGASGCAELRVLGVEAGPTVLADGLEKDLALVVAPSVTLPCAATSPAPLPPLSNVAAVPSGPFTVTIPVAARYEELTHALDATLFTDGKYFFSREYTELYLEHPEMYASDDQLVLKLHLKGPVSKMGIDADIDGDVFLSGHPVVVDNEIRIDDLEPTIETKNLFLSLKAMADSDKIRDEARRALRLDVAERFNQVKGKLSSELTFGGPQACFRGDVDRFEIRSVNPHASYLRVQVAVTARAHVRAPCAS